MVTEQLVAQAGRLQGIDGEFDAAAALLGVGADAAADTPAAGALSHATSLWVGLLRQYGVATNALSGAIAMAAQCYAVTDDSVVSDG